MAWAGSCTGSSSTRPARSSSRSRTRRSRSGCCTWRRRSRACCWWPRSRGGWRTCCGPRRTRDPFTAQTTRELTVVAKITAFGGLGVWVVSNVAKWALSATMLESGAAVAAARLAARMARRRAHLRRVRPAHRPWRRHAGRAGHRHLMAEAPEHRIAVHLDELLVARGMTLVELSAQSRRDRGEPVDPEERPCPRAPVQHPDRHLRRARLHPRRAARTPGPAHATSSGVTGGPGSWRCRVTSRWTGPGS